MFKTGVDTLREVSIFEKPKYAFIFRKGENHYETYEIWGIGKIDEFNTIPETRKNNEQGAWETSPWFRLLHFEYGVLIPLEEEDIILLNEKPTKKEINDMIGFINRGSDACCFTTNKLCGEVENEKS